MTHNTPENRDITALPAAQSTAVPRFKSCELFQGQSEILIEHQGAEYRLRVTRSGGLILNK